MNEPTTHELVNFKGTHLSSLRIGIASTHVAFSRSNQDGESELLHISIFSPFKLVLGTRKLSGVGTDPYSVSHLIPCLNLEVKEVNFIERVLTFVFIDGSELVIKPRNDCYESYIIHLPDIPGGIII